jgi:hypothetical protein
MGPTPLCNQSPQHFQSRGMHCGQPPDQLHPPHGDAIFSQPQTLVADSRCLYRDELSDSENLVPSASASKPSGTQPSSLHTLGKSPCLFALQNIVSALDLPTQRAGGETDKWGDRNGGATRRINQCEYNRDRWSRADLPAQCSR